MADRRKQLRPSSDRRDSGRAHLFRRAQWKHANDGVPHRGTLIGASSSGIALLIEPPTIPGPGTLIEPEGRVAGLWRDPVEVVRVDQVSELAYVIAAEYPNQP